MEWNDPAFAMRGRTHEELQAIIKDDLVIYIIKSLIESLFGGLWVLVLGSIFFGLKDFLRICWFGFRDTRDMRTFNYLRGAGDRMRVGAFIAVVMTITLIMLVNEAGRRVLSYGAVTFLLGFSVYYIGWSGALFKKTGVYAELDQEERQEDRETEIDRTTGDDNHESIAEIEVLQQRNTAQNDEANQGDESDLLQKTKRNKKKAKRS